MVRPREPLSKRFTAEAESQRYSRINAISVGEIDVSQSSVAIECPISLLGELDFRHANGPLATSFPDIRDTKTAIGMDAILGVQFYGQRMVVLQDLFE